MTMLLPILRSKWLWITVLVLLAIWLLGPRIQNALRRVRMPDRGNYAGQAQPNAADRARLEALAARMREEIYTVLGWDEREDVAGQLLAVNDTELRYLAQFYKQIADGNSLLTDVQNEWGWFGPNKQLLIARLLQLNL